MYLFHGTYFLDEIMSCGKLIPSKNEGETTKDINFNLHRLLGINPRGNCVYLSDCKLAMEGFNDAFRFSTNELNLKKLFVADYGIIDEFYENLMNNSDERTLKSIAMEYIESIIPFSSYCEEDDEFISVEFLYFDEILVEENHRF